MYNITEEHKEALVNAILDLPARTANPILNFIEKALVKVEEKKVTKK